MNSKSHNHQPQSSWTDFGNLGLTTYNIHPVFCTGHTSHTDGHGLVTHYSLTAHAPVTHQTQTRHGPDTDQTRTAYHSARQATEYSRAHINCLAELSTALILIWQNYYLKLKPF